MRTLAMSSSRGGRAKMTDATQMTFESAHDGDSSVQCSVCTWTMARASAGGCARSSPYELVFMLMSLPRLHSPRRAWWVGRRAIREVHASSHSGSRRDCAAGRLERVFAE